MMSGGWIVVRMHRAAEIGRSLFGHDDGGEANPRRQLSMKGLGNARRAGRRVVLRQLAMLRGHRRHVWRSNPGSNCRRPRLAVTQFDQRREDQQRLRKNRHACQRVTNCRRQTSPRTDTHGG